MSDTQDHDCAVALCTDRRYLHLALFLIRQIDFHNPQRRFDIVLVSADVDALPSWTTPFRIRLHRPGPLPEIVSGGQFANKAAYLHRLLLARELGHRYRRILYLDCDMFLEGGDLNRLLDVDLGPHPLGAVLDAAFLYEAGFHAREYRALGWPAMPYANSGLQLIDTAAYLAAGIEERSFEMARQHPQALILSDQSMINLALKGGFAQLAPAWNWQWNARFPLVPLRYPVFLRHFIGPAKPDRTTSVWLDSRFNSAYRDFLTAFAPELVPKLAPPCDPTPMGTRQVAQIVLKHVKARGLLVKILGRHADAYRALV